MSFILEALRKSEAARRRNEAPDLFSPLHEPPAPARERANAPVWIVGVVGVLSLGIATWLVLQRDTAPAAPAAPAIETAPSSPPSPEAATPVASAPTSQAIVPTPPDPEAPPAAAPATTAPATTTPATTATPPPPPLPAPLPSPPVQAPPPLPAPPPAGQPRPAASDRAMPLSDLDAGSRKQLPALRMSMHMWNEEAGRRFVILDGQRLGEGDLIGGAQVEAITRDGVVLNWQGARLRIDTR